MSICYSYFAAHFFAVFFFFQSDILTTTRPTNTLTSHFFPLRDNHYWLVLHVHIYCKRKIGQALNLTVCTTEKCTKMMVKTNFTSYHFHLSSSILNFFHSLNVFSMYHCFLLNTLIKISLEKNLIEFYRYVKTYTHWTKERDSYTRERLS